MKREILDAFYNLGYIPDDLKSEIMYKTIIEESNKINEDANISKVYDQKGRNYSEIKVIIEDDITLVKQNHLSENLYLTYIKKFILTEFLVLLLYCIDIIME